MAMLRDIQNIKASKPLVFRLNSSGLIYIPTELFAAYVVGIIQEEGELSVGIKPYPNAETGHRMRYVSIGMHPAKEWCEARNVSSITGTYYEQNGLYTVTFKQHPETKKYPWDERGWQPK